MSDFVYQLKNQPSQGKDYLFQIVAGNYKSCNFYSNLLKIGK